MLEERLKQLAEVGQFLRACARLVDAKCGPDPVTPLTMFGIGHQVASVAVLGKFISGWQSFPLTNKKAEQSINQLVAFAKKLQTMTVDEFVDCKDQYKIIVESAYRYIDTFEEGHSG